MLSIYKGANLIKNTKFFLINFLNSKNIFNPYVSACNYIKHEKIVVKTFKVKGLRKWFNYFLFLNHSLWWFLVVPPKDGFVHFMKKFQMKLDKIIMVKLMNFTMNKD